MNAMVEYWKLTVSGFERILAEYKYLALIIGIIIYSFINWRKYRNKRLRTFLLYAAVVMSLLLIPVTGMVFAVYQTRFYDYEWIWSFVPLSAILAWGIVAIVYTEISVEKEESAERKERKLTAARLCGIMVAVAVLFLCGNQGRVQQVSEEQLQIQQAGKEVLQYVETEGLQGSIVWAPKDIMQYIRSHSGEVRLFYGRDMWDAKAGAYDYDSYSPQEMACYEWMECVSSPHNLYLLEVNQAPENVHEALATDLYLGEAIAQDVDIIVLPEQVDGWMERKIRMHAEEKECAVTTASAGEYTIWIFGKVYNGNG